MVVFPKSSLAECANNSSASVSERQLPSTVERAATPTDVHSIRHSGFPVVDVSTPPSRASARRPVTGATDRHATFAVVVFVRLVLHQPPNDETWQLTTKLSAVVVKSCTVSSLRNRLAAWG